MLSSVARSSVAVGSQSIPVPTLLGLVAYPEFSVSYRGQGRKQESSGTWQNGADDSGGAAAVVTGAGLASASLPESSCDPLSLSRSDLHSAWPLRSRFVSWHHVRNLMECSTETRRG